LEDKFFSIDALLFFRKASKTEIVILLMSLAGVGAVVFDMDGVLIDRDQSL
jgi:hypothetical protein